MSRQLSLKIGSSGVRGVVGESLTPQLVISFAAAFGSYCGAGPILVGGDSRPSREMILQAAISGLMSVGCTPVDVGIVPVPALMHHVRETGAFGGISISASHNPIEWNAMKFVGPDGVLLRPNQAAELTDLYHQGVYTRVPARDIPSLRYDDTALKRHRASVLKVVDMESIRRRRFRVAIDCCNGAASEATPALLRELGCVVVPLHTDPSKPFPHNPEPVPENLGDLCLLVRSEGADLGLAQDADGDRLALVDENGVPLGEDCTLALAADHWLRRRPGPLVANVSTSRMVDDIAARYGCQVFRTRVGEIHVVDRMVECSAEIGGEGNGGVILRPVHSCRDSFAAISLILESIAVFGGTMSGLRGRVPTYAILKEKLLCPARETVPSLRLLERYYQGQQIDRTDGIKVIWPDRWLLARPSSTEPVIRIVAEAPTEPEARSLLNGALECLSPTIE